MPCPWDTAQAPAMSRGRCALASSRSGRTPSGGGQPRDGRGSTRNICGKTGVAGGGDATGAVVVGCPLAGGVADAGGDAVVGAVGEAVAVTRAGVPERAAAAAPEPPRMSSSTAVKATAAPVAA